MEYKTNIIILINWGDFLKYKVINNINRTAKKSKYKLFFKSKDINNVRFFNSNLTYFHFKKRLFKNVDFLGCNLKNSVFRGGHFINCKFSKTKNFNFDDYNVINSDFSSIDISKRLENKIFILNRVPAFKRSYVFTTKRSNGNKINKGIIVILKNEFSDEELTRILIVINKKTNARIKNFITYGQFYEFGLIYLKK